MLKNPYGVLVTEADKKQAMYQGLLGMGTQLMAGSAPSTQPGGFGRGMAAGGQAFTKGYQGHLNQTQGGALRGLQAKSAQQQLAMNDQKLKQQQALGAWQKSMFTPPLGGQQSGDTLEGGGDAPVSPIQSIFPNANSQQIGVLRQLPPDEFRKAVVGQVMKDPKATTALQHAKFLFPHDEMKQQEYVLRVTTQNKAPTVNVNNGGPKLPPPPKGYAYARDPKTLNPLLDDRGIPKILPIHGSGMDPNNPRMQKAQQRQAATANVVIDDIDRAVKLVDDGWFTAGWGAEHMSVVGGSDSANLKALLNTVKANVGFDKLQAMRDSSPTGGALGQVSERELTLLNAAIGSLEQTQSPEQLRDNLLRVKNITLDIIHGQGSGPERGRLAYKGNGKTESKFHTANQPGGGIEDADAKVQSRRNWLLSNPFPTD